MTSSLVAASSSDSFDNLKAGRFSVPVQKRAVRAAASLRPSGVGHRLRQCPICTLLRAEVSEHVLRPSAYMLIGATAWRAPIDEAPWGGRPRGRA